LITSLDVGGAETMLSRLTRSLPRDKFESSVISLSGLGNIGTELQAGGTDVLPMGGKKGVLSPSQWGKARAFARRIQPHLIHAWMYHANVVGHFLRWSVSDTAGPILVTSVRGALNAPRLQKPSTRLIRRLDALLSSRSDKVLFNSHSAAEQHWRIGYCRYNSLVVANGFDVDAFRPCPDSRRSVRLELGINDSQLVIGVAARFHPLKGHAIFLQASRQMLMLRPDTTFVFVGRGCESGNSGFSSLLGDAVGDRRFKLLGEQRAMARIMNAFDVLVCPSLSESFPNTVGEAMSCGIPCIVTRVGDCPELVGTTGHVVAAGDSVDLCRAMLEMAKLGHLGRVALGRQGRERIIAHFSSERMLEKYTRLYLQLAGEEGIGA